MKAFNDDNYQCEFCFRCLIQTTKKKVCGKSRNQLQRTFLESTKLGFSDIFKVMFWFVCVFTISEALEQIGLSKGAASYFAVRCQVVIPRDLDNVKVGGPTLHVEVHEAQLCTCKRPNPQVSARIDIWWSVS